MPTSEHRDLRAEALRFSRTHLVLVLTDGREIRVPLSFYPRLAGATLADLRAYTFSPGKDGIHWPRLDEDLSVEGIVLGRAVPKPRPSRGLGPLLRAARTEAQLTQVELAKALGLSQTLVSLSEADPPKIPVLAYYKQQVLSACGLPEDWVPPSSVLAGPTQRLRVVRTPRPRDLPIQVAVAHHTPKPKAAAATLHRVSKTKVAAGRRKRVKV